MTNSWIRSTPTYWRTRRRSAIRLAWSWWFAAFAVLAIGWEFSQSSGALLTSTVLTVFSFVAFARLGSSRVTASSIYFLSIGVLVAVPVLYMTALNPDAVSPMLFEFVSAVSLASALTYTLVIRWDPTGVEAEGPVASVAAAEPAWLTRFGAIALAAGLLAAAIATEALGSAAHALASIGVVSIATAAGVSLGNGVGRRFAMTSVAFTLALWVFVMYFFSGYGRLILVGILLAGWMAAATVAPRRWYKPAMLATLVPALILGGAIGIERTGGNRIPTDVIEVLVEARGLGSWTGPPVTGAQLIELDAARSGDSFPRLFGLSYVEAILIPIPRSVWPAKPIGFGLRLTEVLLPRYVASGHSMAATSFGEAYANFGWMGFALLGALVAPVLGALDRWQSRLGSWGPQNRADTIQLLIFVLIVAGIPDFVWGGAASTMARAGIRVLLLLGLAVLLRHRNAESSESDVLRGTPT